MTQHHRIVCGGLFFVFTVAHSGCAGSGLKNLFTRNETDGYHSLDEIDAEEHAVAKTEESADESKPASVAARLTSWRPFSKAERAEEDVDPTDGYKGAKDSSELGKGSGFLSRAFTKNDAVDPDPFLESDSASITRAAKPTAKAESDSELAKIHDDTGKTASTPKNADDESTGGPERKHKSGQYADGLASADPAKTDSSVSDNEDHALAERFEEHFLSKPEATVDAKLSTTGKNPQDNTAGVTANVASKRRDLASIAERQIDSFDSHMGSFDSISGNAEFNRTPEAEPLSASNSRVSEQGPVGNSLAAFDSLMGTEAKIRSKKVIEVENKVTRRSETKTATLDINVADATSLFGAAVARQNARGENEESDDSLRPTGSEFSEKSGWATATEDENAFQWHDPRDAKPVARANVLHNSSNSLAPHEQANLNASQDSGDDSEFGGPRAASENSEDVNYSAIETADPRLSRDSGFATNRRTATTASGSGLSRVVIMPASSESTVGVDFHSLAPAPLVPAPESNASEKVTVASNRPGLLQSLSTRNWLLLIGGIIVIALLFAPGRTKHPTMTNRPANG